MGKNPPQAEQQYIGTGLLLKVTRCARSGLMLIRSQYVRPKGAVSAIGLPAGAFLKAPVF